MALDRSVALQWRVVELVLNGSEPEITRAYSGSLSVNGPVNGYIELMRWLGGKFILADEAFGPRPTLIWATSGVVTVKGSYSTVPGYRQTPDDYKIRFYDRIPPTATWGTYIGDLGPPMVVSGNWTKVGLTVQYSEGHPTQILAELWGRKLVLGEWEAAKPSELCKELPLEVVPLHEIAVDDAKGADARPCQVVGDHGSRRPAADDGDPSGEGGPLAVRREVTLWGEPLRLVPVGATGKKVGSTTSKLTAG